MSYQTERERMVREQIQGSGVRDARVLDVMRRVPRHLFVPEACRAHAYDDRPQPIGEAQTISQPLMVAIMTELLQLEGGEVVLEVGTGSGYQTAILAELAARVVSIERIAPLAERARGLLDWLGYRNIEIHVGDGSVGYPPGAPYDRALVAAGAPRPPAALIEQLRRGGRLVAPIGHEELQELMVYYEDEAGSLCAERHGACVFVPLLGAAAWSSEP